MRQYVSLDYLVDRIGFDHNANIFSSDALQVLQFIINQAPRIDVEVITGAQEVDTVIVENDKDIAESVAISGLVHGFVNLLNTKHKEYIKRETGPGRNPWTTQFRGSMLVAKPSEKRFVDLPIEAWVED